MTCTYCDNPIYYYVEGYADVDCDHGPVSHEVCKECGDKAFDMDFEELYWYWLGWCSISKVEIIKP